MDESYSYDSCVKMSFLSFAVQQFDVVSTPSPINVAYSPVGLDFHMDLIYYESAPGLQLLHCLK